MFGSPYCSTSAQASPVQIQSGHWAYIASPGGRPDCQMAERGGWGGSGAGPVVTETADLQNPGAHHALLQHQLELSQLRWDPSKPAIKMNGSTIAEFVLLGFSGSQFAQLLLLPLVLTCYTTVLFGNLLIMVTVRSDPKLFQCPMYFFLANLSLLDVSFGSVAAPKLLTDLLKNGSTISYEGCLTQVFAVHLLGGVETFILSVMAYDRYVAICHPLRYATIMDRQQCLGFLLLCWIGGLIHGIFQTVLTAQLPLCGPNVLDGFFCDITQLKKLACEDIYVSEILYIFSDSLIILPNLLTLLFSYVTILATLCGRFGKGGRKGLSTCGSHLMVVFLFYGPIILVYIKPSSTSQVDKVASILYVVVTPALNPLIYTLRNKEVKDAMKKLKNKCAHFLLLSKE
ncbi:olfactory receptor 4Q3-like [Tiliqua scincoides]|uniref:olfactory receptor 4Q3-like n=1 Tax=Tiliqua scincoides TaxID=71010 RepID=UPI0034629267